MNISTIRHKIKAVFSILFGAIVAAVCIYGWGQNRKMNSDLKYRLANDRDIISVTGKFVSSELFSSESDCVYIGSCSTSTHFYKIAGEKRCIAVEVVLYENFPRYYVQSIDPAGHWSTSYIGDELIIDNEWQFVECDSPHLQ